MKPLRGLLHVPLLAKRAAEAGKVNGSDTGIDITETLDEAIPHCAREWEGVKQDERRSVISRLPVMNEFDHAELNKCCTRFIVNS
jgi:hypothetical protein